MKINDLQVVIFTTTKGHWGRTDRCIQTLKSLRSQLPFPNLVDRDLKYSVNIKIVKDQENSFEIAKEMEKDILLECPYAKIDTSIGEWKHGHQSKQVNFCRDMISVCHSIIDHTIPYMLFLEDDWLFYPESDSLLNFFDRSVSILKSYYCFNQVRFVRHKDEIKRINGLKEKHGINGMAILPEQIQKNDPIFKDLFFHNDWSNNPYICRTRDFYLMCNIMKYFDTIENSHNLHSEHLVGKIFKQLESFNQVPFCSFLPEKIRVLHIGTPLGEEDVP